ncbi:MAG: hypothetical protein ACRD96_06415 [Bryobacteraceae bacterium]
MRRIEIPQMERIRASLDALEAAFRPLVATIPHDVEPAFRPSDEEEEPAE